MRKFTGFGITLLCTALWLFASLQKEDIEKQSFVSTHSRSSFGLSVFEELGQSLELEEFLLKRKAPFLDYSAEESIILVQSPQMPFSEREAAIIAELVSKYGKTLIISFHDQVSYETVRPLLQALSFSTPVRPNDDFRDRSSTSASPPQSVMNLFTAQEQYAFYGRLFLGSETCKNGDSFACFVEHREIGDGELLVIASLSLLSNSMIGKERNELFARAIYEQQRPFSIDEYRNFFSEKTLSDLLLTPWVSLPLLGLFLAAVTFFLFGFREDSIEQDPLASEPAGLHQTNASLLAGLLKDELSFEDGVKFQAKFIAQEFPEYRPKIDQVFARQIIPYTRGQQLAMLHQQLLRKKGVR